MVFSLDFGSTMTSMFSCPSTTRCRVIDFKYIGPPYILCNPTVATPGLQFITAYDLKNYWRSDHYGALSKGMLSRPAIVIENP